MRGRLLRAAIATLVVVTAASCSGMEDRLFVVANPGAGQQSVEVWAVTPGDHLDDDHTVLPDAVGPLTIVTRGAEGELTYDQLGQAWKDRLLMAAATAAEDPAEAQQVLAARPGDDPTQIAAAAQAEVVVAPRGVFVFDSEGCRLATRPEKAKEVGKGRCSVSDNDRWVASWPSDGGPIEVRDLRRDEVATAEGNFTQAVALTNDARVLGIESTGGGDGSESTSVAKVIDATNGKVISTGEPAGYMQAMPSAHDSRSFVVMVERDGIPSIESIGTDGKVSVVAESTTDHPMFPVNVGDGVDYLIMGKDFESTALYHWSPDEDAERVMKGELTAIGVDPETTVVARQVEDGLEFWSVHDGELSKDPEVVLHTDTTEHLQVGRALTVDGVAHLEVSGVGGSSYVRVDTRGGHSAVVLSDWASLSIAARDRDGTVLLSGAEAAASAENPEQQLLAVRRHDDEAERRASAEMFAASLVHDGTIYYTAILGTSEASVWQVPVSNRGDARPEKLWDDALLGGAAWEQYGGASETNPIDPVQIAQQSAASAGSGSGGTVTGG
jgi:hypothetical protein